MAKIAIYTESQLFLLPVPTVKSFKDLTGMVFDRLSVIGYVNIEGARKWACKCECGNFTAKYSSHLLNGSTRSCGCLFLEVITKHGHETGRKQSGTYATWRNMIRRCSDPKILHYENYGGRGITVCDRWVKFENFLEDMGERPVGMTIERIDNNGNYEPRNCRWATKKEQGRNKRNNKILTFMGQSMTATDWAEKIGVEPRIVLSRLNTYKWSVEKTLTTPVIKYMKRNANINRNLE